MRKQKLDKIKEKEQNINNDLFKKYFKHRSPSNMYKKLDEIKNIEINQIEVDFIKITLSKLQKDSGNTSNDNVNKIQEMYKIADIVELILSFNEEN